MNCQNVQASFDERLDDRLDAAQQAQVGAHLASCADCRRQWQAYAAVWQTLERLEPVEPSFGFAQRTLRRLEEPATETRPVFWRLPVFRLATLACLVAVISLGGWLRWKDVQDARRAEVFALTQDRLEDFDVIVALDQISGENQL